MDFYFASASVGCLDECEVRLETAVFRGHEEPGPVVFGVEGCAVFEDTGFEFGGRGSDVYFYSASAGVAGFNVTKVRDTIAVGAEGN